MGELFSIFDLPPWFLVLAVFVIVMTLRRTAKVSRRYAADTRQLICRGCGAVHPTEARYCRRCGRKLD